MRIALLAGGTGGAKLAPEDVTDVFLTHLHFDFFHRLHRRLVIATRRVGHFGRANQSGVREILRHRRQSRAAHDARRRSRRKLWLHVGMHIFSAAQAS